MIRKLFAATCMLSLLLVIEIARLWSRSDLPTAIIDISQNGAIWEASVRGGTFYLENQTAVWCRCYNNARDRVLEFGQYRSFDNVEDRNRIAAACTRLKWLSELKVAGCANC